MMKKLLIALALTLLSASAWGQPVTTKVPTSMLVTPPLPITGGTLQGKVITLSPTIGGAGLNFPQGTAPIAPVNGDFWATSTGFYGQIAGSTIGPLASTANISTALPSATSSQLYIGTGGAGVAAVASTLPTAAFPTLTGDVTNSGLSTTVGKIGGKAVTLGGALTTTGAATPTLAFGASGSYTYTFPGASGTLATTANINTALPSTAINTLYGGSGGAGVAQAVTLGTGLSISGGVMTSTGSGTVTASTAGQLAAYTGSTTVTGQSNVIYANAASGSCPGSTCIDPTFSYDSSAGLTTIIASLPATGGDVYLCGHYSVPEGFTLGNGSTTQISTKQGIYLHGCGHPSTAIYDAFTGFVAGYSTWLDCTPCTSTNVITVAGPLLGWGIENIGVDAHSGVGASCLAVVSASFGRFNNFALRNCNYGINSTAVASESAGSAGLSAAVSQQNYYEHGSILVANIADAIGINLTGVYQASGSTGSGSATCPCLADTFQNVLDNILIDANSSSNAQFGIVLAYTDTNQIRNVGMLMGSNSGSYGYLFTYESATSGVLPGGTVIYGGYVSNNSGASNYTHTIGVTGTPNASSLGLNWVDRPSLVNADTWQSGGVGLVAHSVCVNAFTC